MSRSSPAPRGFRGTPTMFRVGQNIFDGRHFTSLAGSVQRTELRCPLKGIRPSCEVPHPPTSFSPCGSLDRWQVLRELRVILCQRFFSLPSPKREITNFCPGLSHLSTALGDERSHTNHLVASFPQRSRLFWERVTRFEVRIRLSRCCKFELRSCSFLQPSPVGVTPTPSYRRASRL